MYGNYIIMFTFVLLVLISCSSIINVSGEWMLQDIYIYIY